MGGYRIPNALSIREAAAYLGVEQTPDMRRWQLDVGGVIFFDPDLTDAECEALYTGFTPSGVTDDQYTLTRPAAVQDAIDTLAAFYNADPATITDAQNVALHRAEVIVLRWTNRRLES